MSYRILVINPGSTSTKVAVYAGREKIYAENIKHPQEEIAAFSKINDQKEYRIDLIYNTLSQGNIKLSDIDAVIGRGGLGKPIEGGIYAINDAMLNDVKNAVYGDHAANLGAIIAKEMADSIKVPALVMDPVSVDEMEPEARISGLKEIPRVSMMHTLNSRAVAKSVAHEKDRKYEDLGLIVAHLGAGISITPHVRGRIIDCNNPNQGGPMCPERSGSLPVRSLVELCYSGKYADAEALIKKMNREGGIYDHLGTKDLREAEKMAKDGNEYADLILNAMIYQIAKEIGAMATVLKGNVDYIILTGGMAYSERLTKDISERVRFIAPIIIKPGENELDALADGALRAMKGEEEIKIY
ncbi:MAG: butyrate kinase [Eubacteriales bacterium]|nr:butyrate kinase [Eubacteriales bacterium]